MQDLRSNTRAAFSGANVFRETVVQINRVTKVVKGGKRLAFNALVVVGDGKGQVGFGVGKAREVQVAISKAIYQAKKHMILVPLVGNTIPHAVVGEFCAGRVLLKPASSGTGVLAGGGVRAVLEAVGVKDVLSKSLGSSSSFNVVYATLEGLKKLRTKQEIAELRGKKPDEI